MKQKKSVKAALLMSVAMGLGVLSFAQPSFADSDPFYPVIDYGPAPTWTPTHEQRVAWAKEIAKHPGDDPFYPYDEWSK